VIGSPNTPRGRIVEAPRNAYYIVAPPYIRWSAGIKALHFLCHALNRSGERAYMVIRPFIRSLPATHPDLLTPLLSKETIVADASRLLTPITVYPETVEGNPLNGPLVVRYVMNFPGLLGGQSRFPRDELCFGYSSVLASAVGVPQNKLFIPASDIDVFHPEPRVPRQGTCFFAGKYKDFHRASLSEVTKDSVEITRDQPDSQSPFQIADLFRRSELFYCYENSALAIEAVLCECPVVFLPNEHLTSIIAAEELGLDGYAWGADPQEVERAKATVSRGRLNYLRTYEDFWPQLRYFIEVTQQRARSTPYDKAIIATRMNTSTMWDDIKRLSNSAAIVVRRQGLAGVREKIGKRISRLLPGTKPPTQPRW
jgi:hypothetical protein